MALGPVLPLVRSRRVGRNKSYTDETTHKKIATILELEKNQKITKKTLVQVAGRCCFTMNTEIGA